MSDLYTQFDNVFFEKTRLSMMTVLYKEEKVSFNRFKDLLGTTDGAIYTHLEKLIKGKYIEKKKEIVGTSAQTVYSLTKTGQETFTAYIAFMEKVLKDHD